jgi:hypothetical protein
VLTLIAVEEAERELTLATLMREAILAAVTTGAPPGEASALTGPGRVAGRAVALQAVLPAAAAAFTPAERGVRAEGLDRLIRVPCDGGYVMHEMRARRPA